MLDTTSWIRKVLPQLKLPCKSRLKRNKTPKIATKRYSWEIRKEWLVWLDWQDRKGEKRPQKSQQEEEMKIWPLDLKVPFQEIREVIKNWMILLMVDAKIYK